MTCHPGEKNTGIEHISIRNTLVWKPSGGDREIDIDARGWAKRVVRSRDTGNTLVAKT